MTLNISSVFTYDEDAGNYIQAVEAADEADTPGIGALEPATRQAINNFVLGCKADGIWDAIKASCILAGARTLNGALVPLAGAAPTDFNFVAGDYGRKTGLAGDGATKYLDSKRNNNADPQNNRHFSAYATNAVVPTIGANVTGQGRSYIIASQNGISSNGTLFALTNAAGLFGLSRSDAGRYIVHSPLQKGTIVRLSSTPDSINFFVNAYNDNGTAVLHSSSRIAFYSIGESLDLAKLDSRVTDLITAFGAAIP